MIAGFYTWIGRKPLLFFNGNRQVERFPETLKRDIQAVKKKYIEMRVR